MDTVFDSIALRMEEFSQRWDRLEMAGWEIIKLERQWMPPTLAYAYLRRMR